MNTRVSTAQAGRVEGNAVPSDSAAAHEHDAPSWAEPATREKAAMAGYDHRGGTSTLLPTRLSDHLGARPSPNTETSGTVSGEAWSRDKPSQATAFPGF